jgi:hypothetical protein
MSGRFLTDQSKRAKMNCDEPHEIVFFMRIRIPQKETCRLVQPPASTSRRPVESLRSLMIGRPATRPQRETATRAAHGRMMSLLLFNPNLTLCKDANRLPPCMPGARANQT